MGKISGVSLLQERTVPPLQSDIHMGHSLSLPARTTTFSTPSLPPISLTSFFLSPTQHSPVTSLFLPSPSRHARGPPCFKSPFELSSQVSLWLHHANPAFILSLLLPSKYRLVPRRQIAQCDI